MGMSIEKTSPRHKRVAKKNTTERKDIIIHIDSLKCDVEANPDVYSDDDAKKLRALVNSLSKSIWIDRTYVCFKGNRWKDAFIVEDKWYELVGAIIKTKFGKKAKKEMYDFIVESVFTIAIVYLYTMILKYGYNPDDINITLKKKANCRFEYEDDDRTTWAS